MLHLRRHHRLGLSLWLVITLLFTQLASAAYACPQLRAAAPVVSDSAASADMAPLADMSGTPDMADCDGMMSSGMEGGMNESYAALDRLLVSL